MLGHVPENQSLPQIAPKPIDFEESAWMVTAPTDGQSILKGLASGKRSKRLTQTSRSSRASELTVLNWS